MAEEQQLGDYNLPQMSTSSKEKNPEKKAEPHNKQSPQLDHKKCKTKSL